MKSWSNYARDVEVRDPHVQGFEGDAIITDRTQVLRPIPEQIPDEMKQVNRWMGYCLVEKTRKDGTTKYSKEPRQDAVHRPDAACDPAGRLLDREHEHSVT